MICDVFELTGDRKLQKSKQNQDTNHWIMLIISYVSSEQKTPTLMKKTKVSQTKTWIKRKSNVCHWQETEVCELSFILRKNITLQFCSERGPGCHTEKVISTLRSDIWFQSFHYTFVNCNTSGHVIKGLMHVTMANIL